jgi:pSer/pThr/pTyr-binding forkhead associated (FHA) protein
MEDGIPTAEQSEQSGSEKSSGEMLVCPKCGLPDTAPDAPCPRCGYVVSKGPDTLQVDFRSMVGEYVKQLRGDAFLTDPNPVTFEINGQQVTLPQGNDLVIGRRAHTADQKQPDVDLSRFAATQMGVSRTHMRLVRRDNLLYISDLDSRNGTWLNGKRLVGRGERVVRDGDEVQLGKLRITIRFRP